MKNIIGVFLLLMFASCSTEGFKTYDGGNFLFFSKNFDQDSTMVSFFFHPGETELIIPLQVDLSGLPLSEAKEYRVVVVSEETTVHVANYKLEGPFKFGVNRDTDSLYVKVIKSDDLDTKKLNLVIEILENENFTPGVSSHGKAKIVLTNIASKPDWWDSKIEKAYLGKYSDKKFQLFIQVTGVTDLTGRGASEITAWALALKYYLQKHIDAGNPPIYDEDNNEVMKVPVIG